MRHGGGFLDEISFKWIFGDSLQAIQQKYNPVGIVSQHQVGSSPIVHNRSRNTRLYIPPSTEEEPTRLFSLGRRGYKLPPPPQDTGSDQDESINEAHIDNEDIDAVMSKLWQQFLSDIAQKAPNINGRAHLSYFKLTQLEREGISEAIFRGIQLSSIWRAVQWKAASEAEWDSAFNNLYPPSGHIISNKVQNYTKCTYYREWKRIVAEAPKETVDAMRKALRRRLFSLQWIPHACTDKLWSTGKKKGFSIFPEDGTSAAPRILLKQFSTPVWVTVEEDAEV
jgi:hypothetical protein